MKKVAIEQVRFKQEEIKKLLNDNLLKMRALVTPALSPNQIAAQINALLVPLNAAVNKKVLELTSLIPPAQTTTTTTPTQPAQPAQADDAKDKHLGPRGKRENKNLPDFWRRNFDYGESPYMHMDEIKTITDRVISKRNKKRKK